MRHRLSGDEFGLSRTKSKTSELISESLQLRLTPSEYCAYMYISQPLDISGHKWIIYVISSSWDVLNPNNPINISGSIKTVSFGWLPPVFFFFFRIT